MGLLQDLRFAFRLLVKDRWFALVAVVTLALGIAANNAVFTFVNAVLLRGMPFKESDRILAIGTRDTRNRNMGGSFLDFEDWRRSARSFSDMCLFGQPTLNVSDAGRAPERYNGAVISANIFRLLGVKPLLGPGFSDDDDRFGAPPRVVLGYGIWQTRYGGRADIIGQSIRIDDLLATVVGVMPAGMQFPPNTDVWLPMGQSTIVRGQGRQVRSYQVIGRLANGVTPAQALGELQSIFASLAHDFPKTNEGVQPRARAQRSHLARRVAMAHRSSIARRERAAGLDQRRRRVRSVDIRHPVVRCRDPGRREALLHGIQLRHGGLRVLHRRLSRDRHRLWPRAGASCLQDERERSAEGRWAVGNGWRAREAMDGRVDRREPHAHAGAAGGGRVHDAQLPGDVPHGPGRRHVTPAHDADGALGAQIPQFERPQCLL